MKNNYQVKQQGTTYTAYKDGKILSIGCITEADSLHSIWLEEGSLLDDFYVLDEDGNVSKIHRESVQ